MQKQPFEAEKRAAEAAPKALSPGLLRRADLKDHPGAGELDQRGIRRIGKTGGAGAAGRSAAGVPHRAVIGDIGTLVRTEPDIERPVERGGVGGADERLIACVIAGKVLERQRQRCARVLIEVDQLDFVANVRRRRCGVRWREPEIPLQAVQRGTVLYWSANE